MPATCFVRELNSDYPAVQGRCPRPRARRTLAFHSHDTCTINGRLPIIETLSARLDSNASHPREIVQQLRACASNCRAGLPLSGSPVRLPQPPRGQLTLVHPHAGTGTQPASRSGGQQRAPRARIKRARLDLPTQRTRAPRGKEAPWSERWVLDELVRDEDVDHLAAHPGAFWGAFSTVVRWWPIIKPNT